jgi:hypothetical protein
MTTAYQMSDPTPSRYNRVGKSGAGPGIRGNELRPAGPRRNSGGSAYRPRATSASTMTSQTTAARTQPGGPTVRPGLTIAPGARFRPGAAAGLVFTGSLGSSTRGIRFAYTPRRAGSRREPRSAHRQRTRGTERMGRRVRSPGARLDSRVGHRSSFYDGHPGLPWSCWCMKSRRRRSGETSAESCTVHSMRAAVGDRIRGTKRRNGGAPVRHRGTPMWSALTCGVGR